MSSDSTGEIYVVTKTDGSGVNDVRQVGNGGSGGGSGTGTGSAPVPTESTGGSSKLWKCSYWAAGAAVVGGILPLV
jgi:hypothetical protein